MSQQFLSSFTVSLLTATLGIGIMPQLPGSASAAIAQTLPAQNAIALDQSAAPPEPQTPIAAANRIAQVYPHQWGEFPAATLYIRSIPVLTFLGTSDAASDRSNLPTSQNATLIAPAPQATAIPVQEGKQNDKAPSDPVQRATTVAARLNYLSQNNLDASTVTVAWNSQREAYIISINGEELAAIDSKTILPDTTRDATQDAIQATNRLRRLLGNAPPLQASEIALRPAPVEPQPQEPNVISRQRGIASWYGPGFHGRLSASGERFNQNAMTAAHRTLPFGTRVRVTNTNNGRSVIVRINDRGPFIRGRIIDLSVGAAREIGMYNSGIAPVEVEVLGR
jgi:rare lipoprotein A